MTRTAKLLPMALVLLAHVLLLVMLLRARQTAPAPALTITMEADLLPAEAPPLAAPAVAPRRQPPPPAQRPVPVAMPQPVATPLPSPVVAAAPRPVVAPAATPAPAASPPAPPKPAPVVEDSTPPHADASRIGNAKPEYPRVSRQLGEQGRVVLNIQVQSDGTLGQVEVKTSSGYRRLDDAAVTAVKTWKFVPAHQGGVAVAAWYLQPLTFSLNQ